MRRDALEEVFAPEGSRLDLAGGASLVVATQTLPALYQVSAGRLAEFEPTANGGGRLMTTRRPEDLVEVATLAVPESA
jgi:hypothetical protein